MVCFWGSGVLFVFLNCLVKVNSVIYETPHGHSGQTEFKDTVTFTFLHIHPQPISHFYYTDFTESYAHAEWCHEERRTLRARAVSSLYAIGWPVDTLAADWQSHIVKELHLKHTVSLHPPCWETLLTTDHAVNITAAFHSSSGQR